MSLLITAFGPFDGGPNCSEALLRRLASDRAAIEAAWGGSAAFALLEVDTEAVGRRLGEALDAARPTHVLMTGQAAGRAALCFERIARNRRDLGVADARGRSGALGPVRDGGPELRAATWPDLEGAAAALRASGFAAEVSDDAGSHLCNQTLYLALEAAERARPAFVATFLHLPLIPEQIAAGVPAAARLHACAALPLDQMERAVAAFLVHTRRQTREMPDA